MPRETHWSLFQQHQRKLYTWTSTRWSVLISWYSLQPKMEKGPHSLQKQDQQLTVAQIMNSLLQNSDLKKVGKTTRPFSYDWNQISYDSTVEVTNRFKGLNVIRVPEELCMEVCNIVQEMMIETIPKRKEMQKGKMVVWGGLTNRWEKKRSKRQRRKGEKQSECRVPKNSKER